MKENKYDNPDFFNQYSKMQRSVEGLQGAGEWHQLKKMLPDFKGKRVLDLGCGFGWHCIYAAEQGASYVLGTDISEKMLEVAREQTENPAVKYELMAIEDMDFPADSFDIVISSLAFHYIESFDEICKNTKSCLAKNGEFIFSCEHPVFTAQGSQDWYVNGDGEKLFWPVDNYYKEGRRTAHFLGEEVVKYHKTVSTYINGLLNNGFVITGFSEPEPDPEMLKQHPEFMDELRRPMFMIISAKKI